ncbi:MAG: FkbM family methyltransferase [Candidatus Magasanikbacteria bacterium]|nr:FkbM family methyltransferase [Candidatus Magasanikbacteria bacterium]
MFQFIFNFILNLGALLRAPIGRERKIRILAIYVKLSIRYVLSTWFGYRETKCVKFLGMTVEGFSFKSIYFLFSEIFVKNEYFFVANSQTPIIFDCGANIGVAILYFKWLYPQSVVHAFEPDPTTAAMILTNSAHNDLHDVHVHMAALAADDGEIDFFIEPLQSGSLKMSLVHRAENTEVVRVKTQKLSTFLNEYQSIDYLKMDIEGSELEVLKEISAAGSVSRIDGAVFEYHHHIGKKNAQLSEFLSILEVNNFDYIIAARHSPGYKKFLFQDILVTCKRSD